MYKILLFAFIMALLGCKVKKESLKSGSYINSVDSSSASFKRSLNTNTITNSALAFTSDEFEYPEQTAEEKKQGINPKPRLKKRTTGTLKSNTAEKKELAENGDAKDLSEKTEIKTEVKEATTTPYMSLRWTLIGLFLVVCLVLYLCYRFNLVTIVKNFFARF